MSTFDGRVEDVLAEYADEEVQLLWRLFQYVVRAKLESVGDCVHRANKLEFKIIRTEMWRYI